MKKTFLLILAVLCTASLSAQNLLKTDTGIEVEAGGQKLCLQLYSPSTIRVLKSPLNLKFEKQSLSVIQKPQQVKYSVKLANGTLMLKTQRLQVNVDLTSGVLSFSSFDGKPLLKEKNSATFEDFDDAGIKSFHVTQAFVLDKDEAVYGLGQIPNGKMSQRNQTTYMIQSNLEDFTNVLQSVKGYGIFWDNYSPTTYKDDTEGTSFASEVGDCVDYYFMYGGNADGVVAQMRALTGQVPMFPMWTYGYWQSKEKYNSQNELTDVINKYREQGVPLDGIIQDWQYWGNNYLWNAMDFLNTGYPNPKKMVDDIHALHAHQIISIWASFGPQTKPFKEMEPNHMLLSFKTWPSSGSEMWPPKADYPSGVRPYDVYNPGARDIYWKYLNKGIFSLGMDGWWMDSTDPDHVDFKDSDLNEKTYLGSFRKVRNAFPLMTVGGVYDHQRATSTDKRVFILTRSAFAGQQRYGANTWSGDTQASWETLLNQISEGLNFSLTGIPHWNSDIGGFFLGKYPKKLADPDYQELYVRWIQFGAFCPMMRSHGTDAPREIYQFGKAGEPVYDAIKKNIELRYSLLPYIYSTSWDVTAHQSTFMRALMMDFASDKKTWNINDEYMFGKSFLVCPVTKPVAQEKQRTLYLPSGTEWYDFYTNAKTEGGKNITQEFPLSEIPLYVKAGSIVIFGPEVQYATEKPWNQLTVSIYPGKDADFTLYEDEFDNYNYEKGAYTEIPMKWNNATRTLTIGKRKGSYKGMLANRTFSVKAIGSNEQKSVHYMGKAVQVHF